jgi:hypothetical protein
MIERSSNDHRTGIAEASQGGTRNAVSTIAQRSRSSRRTLRDAGGDNRSR